MLGSREHYLLIVLKTTWKTKCTIYISSSWNVSIKYSPIENIVLHHDNDIWDTSRMTKEKKWDSFGPLNLTRHITLTLLQIDYKLFRPLQVALMARKFYIKSQKILSKVFTHQNLRNFTQNLLQCCLISAKESLLIIV